MDRIRRSVASSRHTLTRTPTLESSLENGNGFGSAIQLAEDRIFSASPEPMSPQVRSFSASTIRSPLTVTHTSATDELSAFQHGSMDSVSTPTRWRSGTDPGLPQRPPLAHANTFPIGTNDSPEPQETVSAAKQNFRAIAKKVIVQNRTTQAVAASVTGGRKDSLTSMPPGVSRARSQTRHPLHPFSVPRRGSASETAIAQHRKPPRLAHIVPSLRSLQTRETLYEHTALVRHLQFSPDGEFCESTFKPPKSSTALLTLPLELRPVLGIKLLLFGKLVNNSRCTENSHMPKALWVRVSGQLSSLKP